MKEMGNSINAELGLHARILEDMELGVDDTQGRLTSITRRVNRLLESTSGISSLILRYYILFLLY